MPSAASTAARHVIFASIAAARVGRTAMCRRTVREPPRSSQAAFPIERAAPPQHTVPWVHSLKASGRRPRYARQRPCRAVIRNPSQELNCQSPLAFRHLRDLNFPLIVKVLVYFRLIINPFNGVYKKFLYVAVEVANKSAAEPQGLAGVQAPRKNRLPLEGDLLRHTRFENLFLNRERKLCQSLNFD